MKKGKLNNMIGWDSSLKEEVKKDFKSSEGFFKGVVRKLPDLEKKFQLLIFLLTNNSFDTIKREMNWKNEYFNQLLQKLVDDNCVNVIKNNQSVKVVVMDRGRDIVEKIVRNFRSMKSSSNIENKEFKFKEVKNKVNNLIYQRGRGGEACKLMADFILQYYFVKTIRDSSSEEIWIYANGIYKPYGESKIKTIVFNFLENKFKDSYFNRVKSMITSQSFVEKKMFFREQNKYKIPVQNGILDLKTGELEDFTPNKVFFQKIPITYNPDLKCPNIKKFFNSVFEKEEDIKTLIEVLGLCLTRDYFVEKAVLFEGEGRNGKGKTLQLIRNFLGRDNITSLDLQELGESRFAKSDLHMRLANLGGDIPSRALKNVSQFKGLTGRDLVSADRKNQSRIKFENYATLIFSANKRPAVYNVSKAFYSRWIVLNFPYTFVSREEFNIKKDRENIKLRNPHVLQSIIDNREEEFSGLLNWVLVGFKRLYNNDDFTCQPVMDEIKKDWLRKSNSFAAFCMDNVTEAYDNLVSKKDLRFYYHKYCEKYNLDMVSNKVIKMYLQNNFGVSDRRSKKISDDGSQISVWVGVNVNYNVKKDVEDLSSYENDNSVLEGEVGVFDVPEIVNFVKSFGGRVKKSKVNEKFSSELIEKSLEQGEIHKEGKKYYGV